MASQHCPGKGNNIIENRIVKNMFYKKFLLKVKYLLLKQNKKLFFPNTIDSILYSN